MQFSSFKHSRNDSFDLVEMIQSVSRKQYEDMWLGLNKMCTEVLTSIDLDEDDDSETEVDIL